MSEQKHKNSNVTATNSGNKDAFSHKSDPSTNNDVSFDAIASKFDKSIYGSTKGKLRHEMLLFNLAKFWQEIPDNAVMLDAGGGTGEFTRELLQYSDDVMLNDISLDTLDLAREKLADLLEPGTKKQLTLDHGPIQDIKSEKSFDFIACHAVFEWLEHPKDVLQYLLNLLKPGGILSLSFFNRDANLFGNMLYGNFDLINNNMKQKNRLKLASHNPIQPSEVLSWLPKCQVEVLQKAGIRCFHDYLRDKTQQQSHYEQLLKMEKKYCQTEPYLWLGKYFHLVIRKS